MMICKADFEDLFPELFLPRDTESSVAEPNTESVARWEDDSGRATSAETTPQPRREAWSGSQHRSL